MRRFLLIPFILGAACAPAPRPGASRPGVSTFAEASLLAPDLPGGMRAWTVERTPRLSLRWVEQPPGSTLRLRKNYGASVRLFVFSGRLRARVGPWEGLAEEGAFISVPRGAQYRLAAVGRGPTRYLRVVAPDAERETVFESPLPGPGGG